MTRVGAYTAERAAGLSGVPKSTVYYWAREDILVPTISPERVQLWSFSDLMALRTIYWLRQPKERGEGHDIPATSMPTIRRALAELRQLELPVWSRCQGSAILVDRDGHVAIRGPAGIERPGGQLTEPGLLDLTAPFETANDVIGPDLIEPRPLLRIVPGKLGGSPHVVGTRVETLALAALHDAGLSGEKIAKLYPYLDPGAITEAVDLEEQIKNNLQRAA